MDGWMCPARAEEGGNRWCDSKGGEGGGGEKFSIQDSFTRFNQYRDKDRQRPNSTIEDTLPVICQNAVGGLVILKYIYGSNFFVTINRAVQSRRTHIDLSMFLDIPGKIYLMYITCTVCI